MKKLFIILLSALSLTAFAQQKKVAVYVTGADVGICKVLGSKLTLAMGRNGYSVTERTNDFLTAIAKEQSYQQSGAVDDKEISRIGKQFGAQFVCVATIDEAFNLPYISARLIDVETAEVEGTANFSGQLITGQDVVTAGNQLGSNLLSNMSAERGLAWKKVAVYITQSDASKDISHVLGDQLVSGFANTGRYIAIERTNQFLSQISAEHSYQRTGFVDDKTISILGKQFGVQYVCVADITDILGEKYISARMLDVETAEIINMYEASANIQTIDDVVSIARQATNKLSKGNYNEQLYEEGTIVSEWYYPRGIDGCSPIYIPTWFLDIPENSYVGISMVGGDEMDAIGMAILQKILANDEFLCYEINQKTKTLATDEGISSLSYCSSKLNIQGDISYNIQEINKLSDQVFVCRISDGHKNRLHFKMTYEVQSETIDEKSNNDSLTKLKEKLSINTLEFEYGNRQYFFSTTESILVDNCVYESYYKRVFDRHNYAFYNKVHSKIGEKDVSKPIYIFPSLPQHEESTLTQLHYSFSQQKCFAEQLWCYYLDLLQNTLPKEQNTVVLRKKTPIISQQCVNGEFILYFQQDQQR